jgi:hypothetical protein
MRIETPTAEQYWKDKEFSEAIPPSNLEGDVTGT